MTISEKNRDYLHIITTVCGYLNETNSSAEKTRRLKFLAENRESLGLDMNATTVFQKALRMTYSPYEKYYVNLTQYAYNIKNTIIVGLTIWLEVIFLNLPRL